MSNFGCEWVCPRCYAGHPVVGNPTKMTCAVCGFIEVAQERQKKPVNKEKKRRWAYGKHYTGKAKEGK